MTKKKMVSSQKQPTPPEVVTPAPLFPPDRHCGLREHLAVPNLFPVIPWPPDDPPGAKRPNSTKGPDQHAHAVAPRVDVVEEAKKLAHIEENACRREGTLLGDQELSTLNQGEGPAATVQPSVAAARPRALSPLSITALNLLHLNNEVTPTFTIKGHDPCPSPHQNEGPSPAACLSPPACPTPATYGATPAATSRVIYSRYNLRSNPKPLENPHYIYDKSWATIVRANRRFEAERSAKEQQSELNTHRTLTVPKYKTEKKPKKAKKTPKASRNQPMTSAKATPIVHTANNNKINTYLDPATIVLSDVTASPTTANYQVPQAPRTSILKPRPMKRKATSTDESLPTSSGLPMTSAEKTSPLSTATSIRFVETPGFPSVLPKKQKTTETPMAEAPTTSNFPMTSFVEPKPTTLPHHFKYSNPHSILPVDLNTEIGENTKKNEDPPPSGMPEPEKTDSQPLNTEIREKELQEICESTMKLERLSEQEKANQFHRAVENAYQFNELDVSDWDDSTFGTIRKEITEAAALHTKRFFPNWIRTVQDECGLWDLPESPQARRLQLILEEPLQMTPPKRRTPPTRAVAMLPQRRRAPSIHQSIMNPSMASSSRSGGATMSQLKAFGAPPEFYGVPLETFERQPQKKYHWSSAREDTPNPFLTGQSSSNTVPLPESTTSPAQQEQEPLEIIIGAPQALEELLLHPEALLTTEYLGMFDDSGITADDVCLFSPPSTPPIATGITPQTTQLIEAPSPSALASFYTDEELVILKEASAVGDSSSFEDVDKTLDQYAEDYKNCSKTCEDFMKEILGDGNGEELTEFNNCFEEFNLASFLLEDQDMSDVICTEQFSNVIDEAIKLKNDAGAAVNHLELAEKEEETLLCRFLGSDYKESAGEAMQI